MQNSKQKKSKHIFNLALIALASVIVVSSSAMVGCGEDNKVENTSATKVVSGTQVVTEISTVSKDDNNSDDASAKESLEKASNDKQQNNSSDGNAKNDTSNSSVKTDKTTKTNTNTSKSNNISDKNNNSSTKDKPYTDKEISDKNNSNKNHDNAEKALTIDGKKHYVGDLIKCKVYLDTPDVIENFQGCIKYDSSCLKVKSALLSDTASSGSIINSNLKDEIKFNGSNIGKGYKFKGGKEFAEIVYEVVGTGKSTPTLTWNVMTQFSHSNNGTKYVKNNEPANGMKYSVEFSD